ncbi:hypothetical protein [Kocuria sp.]|uniref:hypothetical protein n=1 Tax=Kocuria sp. TaxID=1871328 RepID=UPI0026DA7279|nr:hypothetical protein [Kocuria sp.]MDO4918030.1 hypothetical protein [Kocuria sp.]
MTQPRRALAALAVLALSGALTGCAQQGKGTAIELSSVTPTPTSDTSEAPADTNSCFDVAEALSALELLPLTDQEEKEQQDDDALDKARESLARVQGRFPGATRPAFEDARKVLAEAGDTLQPTEAVRVRTALAPADSWLRTHCSAAPAR